MTGVQASCEEATTTRQGVSKRPISRSKHRADNKIVCQTFHKTSKLCYHASCTNIIYKANSNWPVMPCFAQRLDHHGRDSFQASKPSAFTTGRTSCKTREAKQPFQHVMLGRLVLVKLLFEVFGSSKAHVIARNTATPYKEILRGNPHLFDWTGVKNAVLKEAKGQVNQTTADLLFWGVYLFVESIGKVP